MPMKKVVGNGVSGRRVAMPRFAFWPLSVFRPFSNPKVWISLMDQHVQVLYVNSRKGLQDCGRGDASGDQQQLYVLPRLSCRDTSWQRPHAAQCKVTF